MSIAVVESNKEKFNPHHAKVKPSKKPNIKRKIISNDDPLADMQRNADEVNASKQKTLSPEQQEIYVFRLQYRRDVAALVPAAEAYPPGRPQLGLHDWRHRDRVGVDLGGVVELGGVGPARVWLRLRCMPLVFPLLP